MPLLSLLLLMPLLATAVRAGEEVSYTVDGNEFTGYFAPAEDAKGLILLLHDWDGLTPYEKQRAEMLAETGYSVFAADLFGAGVRPTTVEDKRQHTGELYEDRERLRALMRGALEEADKLGADTANAVAMGYCFGGAAVLELARAGEPLQGFATFHGGLSTPEGQDYSAVAAPVAIYHGSADRAITLDDFAALGAALEENDVPHEMTTFGGAPHAFTVFNSDRYRELADELSWRAFHDFLGRVL
jgi:dienelactone hydrolase